MASKLISLLAGLLAVTTTAQRVDDFTCPDTLPGFYPHLYSCDKYWACNEGEAEQRTCGNGLGFLDTDETFTLEQCAELHLVECGERTELEPPISSPHCPRAWGTYEDPEDCSVFWVCQAGKANRYECPPGLAFDSESRGCRWADQVAECLSSTVLDEDGGQFQCPQSQPGVFTKHAHPADCRQYFLCISGMPREYGCPLGTVFNTGTGNGADGECSEPELVPECRDYYGDQEFDARELSSQGFSGSQETVRERGRSSNSKLSRNSLGRPSVEQPESEELSRPAPVALQEILDRPSVSRARPARPPQFLPTSPPPPPPPPAAGATQRPARLEVITNRPSLRNTFRQTLQTTPPTPLPTTQTSFSRARPFSSRFGTNNSPRLSIGSANRFRPTPPPTTTTTSTTTPPPPPPPPARDEGLPPPAKAAPGPNGEEYYYYYYYDDEEQV